MFARQLSIPCDSTGSSHKTDLFDRFYFRGEKRNLCANAALPDAMLTSFSVYSVRPVKVGGFTKNNAVVESRSNVSNYSVLSDIAH